MDHSSIRNQLKTLFPSLSQTELINEILEKGQFLKLPAKYKILDSGSVIQVVPIVFSGSIKVVREEKGGRSTFLYYIQRGESCALTLSSCLKREKSQVKAVVESDTSLIALPVEAIYDFVYRYPSWNDFVVETYSNRFEELLRLLDTVCFEKIDARLIKYLINRTKLVASKELIISHQEIADDLATSREVISRLLKQLEKRGALKLARGKLTVLNLTPL